MGASAEAESVADHCDGPRVGGGRAAAPLGCRRWGRIWMDEMDGRSFRTTHSAGWTADEAEANLLCGGDKEQEPPWHIPQKQTPHSSPSFAPFPLLKWLLACIHPPPFSVFCPLFALFRVEGKRTTASQVQCTTFIMVFSVTCVKESLALFLGVC